jgi:hypothetical protein
MIFIALHWDESADEMLSALLGDGVELGPLKRLIIEKTEGNPFFMEETVLVLLDEGALVRNGAVKLTGATPTISVAGRVVSRLNGWQACTPTTPDERWRNEPGAGGQDAGVDPQTSAGWF